MAKHPADQSVVKDDRFEVFANASVDGLLVIDADGVVQFANPAAVAMFAEQTANLVGFHLGTPAVRAPTELQLPGKGEIRYVEMRASESFWDGRKATFASLHDITERKRAEEALRESEALLSKSQEIAHTGSWKRDLTANRLTWSDEVYRILGCKPQEFTATYEAFLDFVHPDDRAAVAEAYSRSQQDGSDSYETEHRIVRQNSDEVRYVHERCVHERDETGTIIQSTGMVQDITEYKQAAAAEAEQRALLEAIYRNVPLIIMVVDNERRVQQINGFASQFADRSTEEMLGLRGGEALRCLHALDDPRGCGFGDCCDACTIRNTVSDTLENGKTNLQVEADYHPLAADGRTRAVKKLLISATPLLFQGERMALVTMMDISERKMLENALSQAQKMESVGHLAGGVAHDFNSLLMGIMGYAELCREDIGENHRACEYLDEITHVAERSANLTRQLLAFARKQTIAPKVVDLNDAVGSMLKMLRRLIGEDIDLAWEAGAELWSVKLGPAQVDQFLVNLCVNARDAIGGVGKITIETQNAAIDAEYCSEHSEVRRGDYVMLAVSDDGIGMDRETVQSIFEPFFTTKPAGFGTGLGLATICSIVKQNDGFVIVDSEPGEGTTFRIYLPRVQEVSTEAAAVAAHTDRQGGNETILLVEDEKSILVTMRLFLEQQGYTVLPAESPEAALRLVADYPHGMDLLITDVVMPGMSGRDLAGELVQDYPDMKVLYISGYTANAIEHRGIVEADVAFLSKPFTRDDIARKVREVLA